MKATNNGLPNIALPLESKKRLHDFRRQLASDRTEVQFDDRVLKVLLRYSRRPSYVQDIRKYLNGLKDSDGYAFSRSLKQSKKLFESIDSFASQDHTSFRWNEHYQAAILKVRKEFSSYHLAPLSYNSDDDIIRAIPKLDTHSGWTYIINGHRKKGENLDDVYEHWSAEVTKAILNGSFNKPILPGVRTQGSGEFTSEGKKTNTCKHKTRLVSMVDLYQIISELMFSQPFQNTIARKDFYAGGKPLVEVSNIIMRYRTRYSDYVSLDYSAFDQSISSWLIYDAFDIIKSSFRKMSKYEESIWNVVVHDFVHKTFISKKGVVVSHKGVPSGSMFTQIIDSLVNRIMIETYLHAMHIEGEMIIMGDDNLLYYTIPGERLDVRENIATYLTKNFGVVCNKDKSSYGNRFQYPEFLSREWRSGGEYRHPSTLISKLLFSERFRHYDAQSTPELVVYSYILTYKLGMDEFFDVSRFLHDTKFNPDNVRKMRDELVPYTLRQSLNPSIHLDDCRIDHGYVG